MPTELSAALAVLTLAVAAWITMIIRRAIKNNKSVPPPPPRASAPSLSSEATDTGQFQSIVALMGDQVAIHTKPIAQRLERIEKNQATHSKRLGELGERVARLDERTLKP